MAVNACQQAIYLTGDNFLTNGEKKGSLTFCCEKVSGL
jgi:hypothetical protein